MKVRCYHVEFPFKYLSKVETLEFNHPKLRFWKENFLNIIVKCNYFIIRQRLDPNSLGHTK